MIMAGSIFVDTLQMGGYISLHLDLDQCQPVIRCLHIMRLVYPFVPIIVSHPASAIAVSILDAA